MAAGDTLIVLGPYHNEPPASDYATLDLRNLHPVLDFDDTTDEAAVFTAIMPRHYAGGGLTVYIHYAMTSAEAGDVIWEAEFERIGDQQQDIDSDGFAASLSSGAITVPGTSGLVDICTIAFTNGAEMDSVAAGEAFRIRINRDADNAGDTAVGDAELLALEIRETL